jgi:amidase
MIPPDRQKAAREQMEKQSDPMAKGALSRFAEWQRRNLKRLSYRAMWERFFESVDVFLMPTACTTAYPHNPAQIKGRMIPTPEGGTCPAMDLLKYISLATLTGCPATTAPAGLSRSGLPVGLQIVGPYLEDTTPIGFAQVLAREIGGFRLPPGYN